MARDLLKHPVPRSEPSIEEPARAQGRYGALTEQASSPRDVYEDIYLVPVPGFTDTYVASVAKSKEKDLRFDLLVRVRANMIEWRITRAFTEVVNAAGLQGPSGLIPGTQAALLRVLATEAKLPFTDGMAFPTRRLRRNMSRHWPLEVTSCS